MAVLRAPSADDIPFPPPARAPTAAATMPGLTCPAQACVARFPAAGDRGGGNVKLVTAADLSARQAGRAAD